MKWLERHISSVAITILIVNALAMFALYVWSVYQRAELMALLSGIGLVIAIVLGCFLELVPDDTHAQDTERILSMASSTFDHMSTGLTYESAQAACELILPETNAMSVAITDRTQVLGYAGELKSDFPPGSPIHTQETLTVLESGQLEMFSPIIPSLSSEESTDGDVVPAGIIVPLVVQDKNVGTIKFYFHSPDDIDNTQVVIARGLGRLLSAQLNAFELERQSELTAKAEVKALQAQINPHFLFNTLNTIAAFTRTDPDRARSLIRDFSTFYRSTLETSEGLIPLWRELEQVDRYLTFEIARFGEERIVVLKQVQPGMEELPVPSFLVQPLVENAVRHAMRDEGPLNIDVHVAQDGDDALISVTDDGVGMEPEVVEALLAKNAPRPGEPGAPTGTGIALHNVAERVERNYGAGSGMEIVSKLGEGTNVTLRLAGAIKLLHDPADL